MRRILVAYLFISDFKEVCMKISLWVVVAVFFSSLAYAESGLSSLIEVGKSQKEIASALDQETKNFEKVRSDVVNGSLNKGIFRDDVKRKYGEPVIKFDKDRDNPETWIYKPANVSFFDGVKIYLKFDDKGILSEIKVSEAKKNSPEASKKGSDTK